MSFLFKSKKQGGGLPSVSRKLTSADGSNSSSYYARPDASITGSPSSVTTNNSVMRRVQSPTPEPVNIHSEQSISSLRSATVSPPRPAAETSLYPWSQQRLQFVTAQSNPFPRYGAALNAVASREGDIYMMGGLINGVTVKGDLWIVEGGSGSLNCYPVQTTAEGPGARVGHASLLVGNAFIVFGGDTKLNETDPLDDTLYLLNTSTKHWSRALPPGHRPAGRYGHTLNILGSRIYVFGGQVEGYFFNDLVAFDLNALQQANSRWETLIQNTNDGGPPVGQIPPARTNHTIITYNDKLYLFGGTDGVRWFNDVWTYDQRTNSWTAQECIGFIPSAREGHAAALVGDVMYVFGGRTEEGKDLGDLAAFRIPTRRWYTFQNMGPSPSPRSGHGLTAFGDKIIVLAGEPSSAPRDPGELSLVYTLDTTKIRYPTDQASTRSMNASRRPSTTERSQTPQTDRSSSRNGDYGPNGVKLLKQGSQDSLSSTLDQSQKPPDNASANTLAASGPFQRAIRSPSITAPNTPQQPPQPKTNGVRPQGDGQTLPRVNGAKMGNVRSESAASLRDPVTPVMNPPPRDLASATSPTSPSTPVMAGQFTRSKSPPPVNNYSPMAPSDNSASATQKQNPSNVFPRSISQQSQRPKQSLDLGNRGQNQSLDLGIKSPNGLADSGLRPGHADAVQPLNRLVTTKAPDSGFGSSPAITTRNDELLKELEAARSRNAWFASELALARKSGYQSSATDAPVSDAKTAEAFGDDDKPLLEALLRMRAEIAKVQGSLATQSTLAAEKFAQVAKERDTALSEAASCRTRLAAYGWKGTSGSESSRDMGSLDTERSEDTSRRLASALASQTELSSRMRLLAKEVESERKARQLAEESADLALNRATELDTQKQGITIEIEKLRSELHEAQKAAREASATSSEALASSEMLQVDKNELTGKLNAAQENARTHDSVLSSLRDAVVSSVDKAAMLERKLEYEKRLRSGMEDKLAKLRAEHETRVAELETTTSRLRDAEELADSHANEAKTHRDAVLAGLGQRSESSVGDKSANDERVSILQQRVEAANAMVRRNQEAADRAAERLRRAEERVAGLESYQEQTSREGMNVRKQLQLASRETLSLRSENADLQQQLAGTKLDTTALHVQHNALKGLLNERGIDASRISLDRSVNGNTKPERFHELEQQLDASNRAHEEMRATFEQREQEANKGWEDKLAALDNDYQSAVKYLKGTEKMLSKMKTELHRYKSQNKELEDELTSTRQNSNSREAPTEWTNERTSLHMEIERLQGRVQQSTAQLESQMQDLRSAGAERDAARESSTRLQQDLERHRGDMDGLRRHNSILEAKAAEAERKVQMLLDTVGTTVGNYRRDSQLPNGHGHSRGISVNSVGGDSLYSVGGDGAHDGNTGTLPSLEEVAGRNSVALDSLASELETLRSHWETTNKAYRFSGPSELDGNAVAGRGGSLTPGEGPIAPLNDSLASWRKKLDLEERDGSAGRTEAGDAMRQGA